MKPIEVDFGEDIFETLIHHLQPGQPLTAGAVLTALDDEGKIEAFEQMDNRQFSFISANLYIYYQKGPAFENTVLI